MECVHCHAKWESPSENKNLKHCPFCGMDLDLKKKQNEKQPFYFVWGLMHEDTLKKSRHFDANAYHEALDSFLKALKEDNRCSGYIAGFLMEYQHEDPLLETIENPVGFMDTALLFGQVKPAVAAAIRLFTTSILNGNTQDAIRLYRLLGQNDLDPEAVDILFQELMAKGLFNQENPDTLALQAAIKADKKEYAGALSLLEKAILTKDDSFCFLCPGWMEKYTGIPLTLGQRQKYIEENIQNNCMKNVLNGIYRPLNETEHEFDHLNTVMNSVLPFIKDNKEEFLSITKAWLEQSAMLRGIHLSLQQIKNMDPSMEEDLKGLLDLHYEKVYMKPYSFIEKTDTMFTGTDLD